MAQIFYYPASSVSISAIGTNNATAPTTSIQVAGQNSGNLKPLLLDSSGNLLVSLAASPASPLHVIVDSSALPTGASTAANQTTANSSLSSIDGKMASLGQKLMAGSSPVVIASDQSAIPISGSVTVSGTVAATQSGTWNITDISGTVSLPTGAATSALQTTGNSSLSSIDGKLGSLGQKAMAGSAPVVIASDQSAVPVSGSVTVSGTVAATQSGTWNINNVSGTVSLPTGAATAANQTTANSSLSSIDGKLGSLGQKTMSGSAPVVIASDQSAIPASQSGTWTVGSSGKAKASTPAAPLDYSSTNVTSSAYVQVIASTTAAASMVEIFDSSGVTLYFAVGGAGSEVNQFVITPGGNGQVPLSVPSGSRISVKATGTTASTGILVVNLYG